MSETKFKLLLSDIGGVLGTNGWDSSIRDTVCRKFQVSVEEIADRHRLMFDSYERGHMTLDEYLNAVFFGSPRSFTLDKVKEAVFAESVPWPDTISFLHKIKTSNSLKLGLISNEGEGITQHRVDKFGLRELADFMVISHFVHMRKPDREIWQLGLDLAQVSANEAIYIDDRAMFVEIARGLGLTALQYTSLEQLSQQFSQLGIRVRP
jgi:putative hydrolase of the HAD superfamily